MTPTLNRGAVGGSTETADPKEKIRNLIHHHREKLDLQEDIRSDDQLKQKFEFLIIPNTPTAKNQLQALVKIEKHNLCLTWRGRKRINGKWMKSDTSYYSVPEERRNELLRSFERFMIPQDEIELREIAVQPPPPKHVQKALKIQDLGNQYNEALKEFAAKEIEELKATKQLFEEEDITAIDYTNRIDEIKRRYSQEKRFLADNANRNYCAADTIYEDGERNKESEGSFLVEPGKFHVASDKGIEILSSPECGVFQQRGRLVRILSYQTKPQTKCQLSPSKAEKEKVCRKDGSLILSAVDEIYISKILSEKQSWVKYQEREKKHRSIDFPDRAAKYILSDFSNKDGATIPYLKGFICCPTLREDGSVLQTEGYDESSGFYFNACGTTFPHINENPTKEEALEALALLKDLIKDFPFIDNVSRSVALSEILTAVVRRSLKLAPPFANDASTRSSGKTLLASLSGFIAIGKEPALITPTEDDAEMEKRYASALIAGDPILCIDNVDFVLDDRCLCAITTSPTWTPRILGKTERAEVDTDALLIFTGNNFSVMGDLCSRFLKCRLIPKEERPEERKFDRDLEEYVPQNRGMFAAAAITLIRAFVVAGYPGIKKLPAFRTYSDFTRFVRGPLVWLGEADPYDSTREIKDSDPEAVALGTLFAAWHEAIKETVLTQVTAKKLVQIASGDSGSNAAKNLQAVLMANYSKGSDGICTRILGDALRKAKDRVVDGYRLEQYTDAKTGKPILCGGVAQWRVILQG